MKILIVAIASIVVSLASLIFVRCALAQISLTQQDVAAWFSQGLTLRWELAPDTALTAVGEAGSSTAQTFDFSQLKFAPHLKDYITYFSLAASPGDTTWPHARDYADLFGNPPYAEYTIDPTGFGYRYFELTDTALSEAGSVDSGLGPISTIRDIPNRPRFKLPLAFGTRWQYISAPDTLSFGFITSDTERISCDAFGTLRINTGNGPVDYDCLRLARNDDFVTYDTSSHTTFHSRTYEYDYWTLGGIDLAVTVDSAAFGNPMAKPRAVSAYFNPVPASSVEAKLGDAFQLQCFPNPATISITILNAIGTISILDPLGRVLNVPRDGNSFDVSRLANGIYFVRDATGLKKFAIER